MYGIQKGNIPWKRSALHDSENSDLIKTYLGPYDLEIEARDLSLRKIINYTYLLFY